jgi:hypothetical protein
MTESSRQRLVKYADSIRVHMNMYTISVGKSVKKRPLGKSRRRCKDIKLCLEDIKGGIVETG